MTACTLHKMRFASSLYRHYPQRWTVRLSGFKPSPPQGVFGSTTSSAMLLRHLQGLTLQQLAALALALARRLPSHWNRSLQETARKTQMVEIEFFPRPISSNGKNSLFCGKLKKAESWKYPSLMRLSAHHRCHLLQRFRIIFVKGWHCSRWLTHWHCSRRRWYWRTICLRRKWRQKSHKFQNLLQKQKKETKRDPRLA